MNNYKTAIIQSAKMLYRSIPTLIGIMLLIGLVSTLIPKSFYVSIFTSNELLNSFLGSVIGSIMAGNPLTSYVLAGEFISKGIGIIAATAFIVSWVTVGLVQLPAEMMILGKTFAIKRNILSFVFSIITALVTGIIMGLI